MVQHRRTIPAAFLAELKRRRVIRVLLVYAAVAWLLVDVAGSTFPYLALPDWGITLVILLVVAGFPLAAVLGWAYDITPTGVERTSSRQEEQPGPAAAGAAVPPAESQEPPVSDQRSPRPPVTATAKTSRNDGSGLNGSEELALAVLPFVNLGREGESDYFSDGVTEELSSQLSRVPGLRVTARTSAFAFKGKSLDVREIGASLGVASLVEGSVRRAGERVRINVQLVDVASGSNRWSRTFDAELTDVFAVQDHIASAIAESLDPRAPGRPTAQAPGATQDVAAYELYLQGRYFWNKRTEEGLRKSIDCFEKAIGQDPEYGQAYAGLADAYSILVDYGILRPDDVLPAAKAAAERALEIDDRLAEAHASLAVISQMNWQWAAAETGFQQALERDPTSAPTHHRYGLFLAWMGRHESAIEEMRLAHVLDPLSLVVNTGLGWVRYYACRYDEAVPELLRALELDPRFVNAHLALGCAYLQLGQRVEAVRQLEVAADFSGGSFGVLPILGCAYGSAGRPAEARAVLDRLWDYARHAYVPSYYLALAHLAAGDIEQAFAELDRGIRQRCPQLVYLGVEPLLDPLRGDPRFDELVARVGLPGPAPATTGG